jgi:hypothetical protein
MQALARRPEIGSLIGLAAVFAFFAVFVGENFVSAGGAASWLNVASELGIIALPVGLLMIAGQLDLSVGSVLPASSMTVAIVSGYYHAPMVVGIFALQDGAKGADEGLYEPCGAAGRAGDAAFFPVNPYSESRPQACRYQSRCDQSQLVARSSTHSRALCRSPDYAAWRGLAAAPRPIGHAAFGIRHSA